jgi:hypothetical protein
VDPASGNGAADPVLRLVSLGLGRTVSIPFDRTSDLSLAAFDPETRETEMLWEGDAFPGGIAGNDWSISPDGRWASYRSAADAALWILPLPGR